MQSKQHQTKRILVRNPPTTRIQSPETVSAHLPPNSFGYIPESYAVKTCDKGTKDDDYGFVREPSIRRSIDRQVRFFFDWLQYS